MSLVGAVSLTNNTGVFLGSVNLDNLNLDPDQLVYSTDGVNMSGLNLGDGLQQVLNELQTVGNPDIQITSNAIYVNDTISDIQTGINDATQGDVINVSSGSYGGATITISNKQNIAIICPYRGQGSTICELAGGRGLTIANTSSTITINSLQIEGLLTLGATANNYFTNLQCISGITISAGATGNYFFYMSEIAGAITVPNTFAGVLFFSECNFAGASFSLNNVSPLQVQITQSLNLPTSRPVKATFSANNADTSQQITTNTKFLNDSSSNSGKYLSSDGSGGVVWSTLPSLSATNQAVNLIPYCTATNNTLNCESTFYYEEAYSKLLVTGIQCSDIQTSSFGSNSINTIDITTTNINGSAYPPTIALPAGVLKQFYYLSTQTPAQTGFTVSILTPTLLTFDISKMYKITIVYNFNVAGGGGGGVSQCIFAIRDDDEATLQQIQMNLSKPHQVITLVFYVQPLLASSSLSFLASSGDQIENSASDSITWDIQEIN